MRRTLTPILVVIILLVFAGVAYAAFLAGPIGDQPTVTAQLRIVKRAVPLEANEPIPIKIAYRNFDLEPQLRCGPAGPCTGTSPQTVVDGRAQGHVHVYLQKVVRGFPDVDSDSFCIPATKTLSGDYEGTVTGNCPALPRGRYRLTAEFQSNSHVSALKAENKPQDAPTSDATYILVR